jgi:hypothetical protein
MSIPPPLGHPSAHISIPCATGGRENTSCLNQSHHWSETFSHLALVIWRIRMRSSQMMRTPSPQLSWLLSLLWPLLLLPLALLGRGRSQIIPTQRGRCAAGDDILNAVACWPPQEMTFELAELHVGCLRHSVLACTVEIRRYLVSLERVRKRLRWDENRKKKSSRGSAPHPTGAPPRPWRFHHSHPPDSLSAKT